MSSAARLERGQFDAIVRTCFRQMPDSCSFEALVERFERLFMALHAAGAPDARIFDFFTKLGDARLRSLAGIPLDLAILYTQALVVAWDHFEAARDAGSRHMH